MSAALIALGILIGAAILIESLGDDDDNYRTPPFI